MQTKTIVLIIIAVVAIATGYVFLRPNMTEVATPIVSDATEDQTTLYTNNDLGLQFEYQVGPAGFVLEEREPSLAEVDRDLVRSLILTQSIDHERMMTNPPVGGEGPAVIAVHVLRNASNQFSLGAATTYDAYSNYNLKIGPETETVVGGANGVAYLADGLYQSDTVVVAHGGFVYVLVGQFMDPTATIRQDFQSLLDSVSFIPSSNQAVGGKLDIRAVCESALIYMTFPDGVAADAFVADCIDGQHPEVIERFKAEMGLSDGAAI